MTVSFTTAEEVETEEDSEIGSGSDVGPVASSLLVAVDSSAVASAGGSSVSDDCVSSTVDSSWTTSNDALSVVDSSLTDSVSDGTSCVVSSEAYAVVEFKNSLEKSIIGVRPSDMPAYAASALTWL